MTIAAALAAMHHLEARRTRRKMTVYDEVLEFIAHPDPAAFDALAMRVFTYQCEQVGPYRNYLHGLDIRPESIGGIEEIPPLSTQAFKYARLAAEGSLGGSEFLTSGTSMGREERGRHLVARPEVYRASAITHLRRMLFADRRRLAVLALHPTADRMPESSLSQMISWAIEEFASEQNCCAATREGVALEAAIAFLAERARSEEPVCIMTTTAAGAKLLDAIGNRGPIMLPARSRLMDTGGAKGQTTPLTAAEVCDRVEQLLGLDPAVVINEYGMTEMCSQLYDATPFNSDRDDAAGERVKIAPPWLRTFAFNPATMRPMGEGQPGLLGFFDLANVGSVSMIVTEDLGMVIDGAVRILGRAGLAEARGCALGIEEFRSP